MHGTRTVFFPHPLSRGNPRFANAICALAFGRNTFSDQEVAKELAACFGKRYDVIRRFQKLHEKGFDPGAVNEALADQCRYYWRAQNCQVIFGQWEVMYSLWEKNQKWFESHKNLFKVIWPAEDGSYLATRDVLEWTHLGSNGNRNILLVAQADHLPRALWLAQKILNGQVIVPDDVVTGYDPNSVQEWTRDRESFLAREKKVWYFERLPAFVQTIIRHFRDL